MPVPTKIRPKESDVTPEVLYALKAAGCILHRNNIGVCRYGPTFVRYGVGGKGGSDFIGYLPVRVTEAMVGHLVAVFVAPEVKRPKTGRYHQEQVVFRDNVRVAGGISGFCHSWEQGRALIIDFYDRFKPVKKLARKIKKA